MCFPSSWATSPYQAAPGLMATPQPGAPPRPTPRAHSMVSGAIVQTAAVPCTKCRQDRVMLIGSSFSRISISMNVIEKFLKIFMKQCTKIKYHLFIGLTFRNFLSSRKNSIKLVPLPQGDLNTSNCFSSISVVVWLKGPCLGEPHVLGLLL